MLSQSLYNTFGNEVKYRVTQGALEKYLETATVKFPLPEASSEILSVFADVESIDPVEYDAVFTRLVSIGFAEPSAKAMAAVMIQLARAQNVNVMSYFSLNEATLKFTLDSYTTINMMRPPGNRVGLAVPSSNRSSRYSSLIRP